MMAAALILTQLLINQNANKQQIDSYPKRKGFEQWVEEGRKRQEHEEQVREDERIRLEYRERFRRRGW